MGFAEYLWLNQR